MLSRLASAVNKALSKAGFPKVQIEVKSGPQTPWWMQRVPVSEAPEPLKRVIFASERHPGQANYWIPAFAPHVQFKACRMCRAAPGVAALGLCIQCFDAVSAELVQEGLLYHAADRMYAEVPEWVKLLSRVGKPKYWLASDDLVVVVEGKEQQVCDRLNGLLRLDDHERLNRESFKWYEGLR